tara:strand:- start:37753 stop:38385 length:633 start_codon:yes stop_codon:yes gene_type:complete
MKKIKISDKIKLSDKEKQETEILANRILPKSDFKRVIEHDKVYYNALTQHLEFSLIKSDLLQQKVEEILRTQTKENITKNIDTLCEFSKTRLECLDLKARQHIQEKLVEDKQTHFDNVFIPQYNKECEEMKKHFDTTLQEAEAILELTDEKYSALIKKVKYEMEWWKKTDKKQKENDEYRIQLYKPLKRILSAFNREKEKEMEESKYKMK